MNILVFSDTHGDIEYMRDIISSKRMETDLVIHLGDNLKDANEVMSDFPTIAFLGVLGNCDFASMHVGAKYDGTFKADTKKIFYTHGHEYLVSNAKFNGCNVALYGHTHVAFCEEINGVMVINPGSLTNPRDGSRGTYASIAIDGDKMNCKIVEVD